jgi:hypothetical protein
VKAKLERRRVSDEEVTEESKKEIETKNFPASRSFLIKM